MRKVLIIVLLFLTACGSNKIIPPDESIKTYKLASGSAYIEEVYTDTAVCYILRNTLNGALVEMECVR